MIVMSCQSSMGNARSPNMAGGRCLSVPITPSRVTLRLARIDGAVRGPPGRRSPVRVLSPERAATPGLRSVLVEREMRARTVVVAGIRGKDPTSLTLVENDEVIQALATEGRRAAIVQPNRQTTTYWSGRRWNLIEAQIRVDTHWTRANISGRPLKEACVSVGHGT